MKDYLASTDGYTFYHDYYVEQMAKLEHKLKMAEEKRQRKKRAQNQGYDY